VGIFDIEASALRVSFALRLASLGIGLFIGFGDVSIAECRGKHFVIGQLRRAYFAPGDGVV